MNILAFLTVKLLIAAGCDLNPHEWYHLLHPGCEPHDDLLTMNLTVIVHCCMLLLFITVDVSMKSEKSK